MKQQYDQVLSAPKPFVKWAGGKRQLLPTLEQNFPSKFNTYFEPFLGGGAMLFHILTLSSNQKCRVSDLNSDLVLSYVTIRDKVNDLISSLKHHASRYNKDPKTYYYSVRDTNPRSQIEKVSRLIFLNRTCFNGLYRVNSKGKFNVPLGRYTSPNIVNEENLRVVSSILRSSNVDILYRDFSSIFDDVSKNDFVYFDPPYQPVSTTANFTSYTNHDFGIQDLEKLVQLCLDLDKKGAKVMLSNSDSKTVSDMFPAKWKKQKIMANRSINSNSNKRTGHYELLITNY